MTTQTDWIEEIVKQNRARKAEEAFEQQCEAQRRVEETFDESRPLLLNELKRLGIPEEARTISRTGLGVAIAIFGNGLKARAIPGAGLAIWDKSTEATVHVHDLSELAEYFENGLDPFADKPLEIMDCAAPALEYKINSDAGIRPDPQSSETQRFYRADDVQMLDVKA